MGNYYEAYKAKKQAEEMMENKPKLGGDGEQFKNSFEEMGGNKDKFAEDDNQYGKPDSKLRDQKEAKKQKAKGGFFNSFKKGKQKKVTSKSYAVETEMHNELQKKVKQTLDYDVDETYKPDEEMGKIYLIKSLQATYQGSFNREGLPEGKGVVHFRDGSYYSGEFRDGEAHGKGVYIFKNGGFYQGQFRNSMFNGKGEMINNQQNSRYSTYSGQWSQGVPDGQGKQETKEDIYVGSFSKGKKDGEGEYTWKQTGSKYVGRFRDGSMDGNGVIYDESENIIFAGNFENGRKQGEGLQKNNHGSYHGDFKSDQWQGRGTFLWNDGKAYDGQFVASKMQGQGKMYFPSGQIVEGVWSQGHNVEMNEVKNKNSDCQDKLQQIKKNHNFSRASERYSRQSNSRKYEKKHSEKYEEEEQQEYNYA